MGVVWSLTALCFALCVGYLRLDVLRFAASSSEHAEAVIRELGGGLDRFKDREYFHTLMLLAGRRGNWERATKMAMHCRMVLRGWDRRLMTVFAALTLAYLILISALGAFEVFLKNSGEIISVSILSPLLISIFGIGWFAEKATKNFDGEADKCHQELLGYMNELPGKIVVEDELVDG